MPGTEGEIVVVVGRVVTTVVVLGDVLLSNVVVLSGNGVVLSETVEFTLTVVLP